MYRDRFEAPLARLGLCPDNFHALRMLPLLYVAWANGSISRVERALLLDVARERLGLDARAMQLVHEWLESPPPTGLVRDAVACLNMAARASDQPDFGTDDLLQLLWDAERMTRLVAIQTGVPYRPSNAQREALLEMAELMQVDTGQPWLDLLLDLGGRDELTNTLERSAPTKHENTSRKNSKDRARRWRAALRHDASALPVPPGTARLI